MPLGSAPQRNIADGASGGATQMSHHLEGAMQKSSRNRKPSKRNGRAKAGTAAKPARKKSRPVGRPTKRRPTLPLSSAQSGGVVSVTAEANKRANKQAKLLDLLRRPAGATIAALSEVSGWQQHSVRGFLAGVVRKKLGLELASTVEADQRIYRIVAAKQT
jgi:hypothetical protein